MYGTMDDNNKYKFEFEPELKREVKVNMIRDCKLKDHQRADDIINVVEKGVTAAINEMNRHVALLDDKDQTTAGIMATGLLMSECQNLIETIKIAAPLMGLKIRVDIHNQD